MSDHPVNVAVVGLGFMGTVHLRAYLQNPAARVVAVCGQTRLPVNGLLSGVSGNILTSDSIHLGSDVKAYREFEELLADPDIELVDICTPMSLHAEQSIAALKAGKHVLCEKPIARTSASAKEIVQASQSAKGFFMPAMCMRFWPGWSLLKRVVEEKTYGKIQAARFSRLSEMPAWSQQTFSQQADTGGALFDLHIHDSDFVQFLFGRPKSISSTGTERENSIDQVATKYIFPDGPEVSAEGSWLRPRGFKMSYELRCERATLEFESERGVGALRIFENGKEPRTIPTSGDGYTEEISYMLACIRSGKRPTLVTAEDGLRALELCEAEEKSVRNGKQVPL
jgi:predicted dehydrogenase